MATPGTTAIVNGLNEDLTEWGPLYARPTNWWNEDISEWDVDPNNAALQAAAIANVVINGETRTLNELNARAHPDFNNINPNNPFGIPIAVVDTLTQRVHVYLDDQSGESDPGPYPIPVAAKTNLAYIENRGRTDGDRHLIMIDRIERKAYELSYARYTPGSDSWSAGYGAIFPLYENFRRPAGATSTDAAGLCVAAGLIRYDEVYGVGEIEHALRFSLVQNNGYVFPASHDNGIHYPGAPPLGSRVRLKASFDTVNIVGGGTFSAAMQKILRCLQTYGGLMADRGGNKGGFYFQGTMDPRWPYTVGPPSFWLGTEFHKLHLSDFEFVKLGFTPPPGPTGGHRKTFPSQD